MSKIYEALLRAEQDRAAGISPSEHSVALEDSPEIAPLDASQPALHPTPQPIPAPLAAALAGSSASPRTRFIPEPQANVQAPTLVQGRTSAYLDFDPSNVTAHKWEPMLTQLPALDERGKAVEQFRSLRSRMFEFRDLNRLKSIIVSSGLPKEGKSFVAANLAVSFAMHLANRVLLIDGDMRRSTLHHLLGAPGEVGLSEYLSGNAGLMDIMQRADPGANGRNRIPAGLASLTFIAAGGESDKAADLSGNSRFDDLIEKVSPHFDWIVVDSSPVNLVADGVNLARACDGVLLVARGGVTRFQSAQRALGELKASNILGVVLNAVENASTAGGYYGYEDYDGEKKETALAAAK